MQDNVVDSLAPVYNTAAHSSVCASSDVAVIFDVRLSRKLEASYHQPPSALMVQWTCTQIAATTVWSTSNSQLEGTIGRVADTAHTGSFITCHSKLNLLWIHIALSTSMIYTLCYGQYGESQSQLLESSWDSGAMIWLGSIGRFQCIQEFQVMGGKNDLVPEATAILVKSLQAVRKFPA